MGTKWGTDSLTNKRILLVILVHQHSHINTSYCHFQPPGDAMKVLSSHVFLQLLRCINYL